jgi:hypothetical protein
VALSPVEDMTWEDNPLWRWFEFGKIENSDVTPAVISKRISLIWVTALFKKEGEKFERKSNTIMFQSAGHA